jgi:hypothetical protein
MLKQIVPTVILLLFGVGNCFAKQDIKPESYGVVVGADQPPAVRAANYTAMNACVQAAMATKKSRILLPPATIEIDIPNKRSLEESSIRVTGDLEIVGADRALSRIKCGPEAPPYDYALFSVWPRTNVLIKDCTLEGPSNPGPHGNDNQITCAIRQVGSSQKKNRLIYDEPGEIRLHNVAIAGEFFNGIIGDHGDCLLELIDCDITGYIQCVGWFAKWNTGKRFHAYNTYFHDAGIAATASSSPKGHLVYLSPCVSYEINNCRFSGNYRYAIHHYGSSNLAPQYAKLSNSVFEHGCIDGVETTHTGLTQITGCTFNNQGRGIVLKGDAEIQDCTFSCSAGISTYDNHSQVQISISQCRFNVTEGGVITSLWPSCSWRIANCVFTGKSKGAIAVGDGAIDTEISIDDCDFEGTWGRAIHAVAGSFVLNRCRFSGNYSGSAIQQDEPSGNLKGIEVTNCEFNNDGQSIWSYAGGGGKIRGSGNHFVTNQPLANPDLFQLLELRAAVSPKSLPSAATLTPNFNYNTYRVTGTSTIYNIKLAGVDEVNRMCAGKLLLISEGAWSLANSGNIKPRTTAVRKAGKKVLLVHDPQAGYWYEVQE